MQVVDGFRQRGEAMTRLETFTDAAFAFAVTMLVFVVLVYVYPLKALYSGAFHGFTGGYLESYFAFTSAEDIRTMFIIFGSAYIALSGVIVLLNRHALSKKEELELNELEVYETISTLRHWIINMVVPGVSILLALTVPDHWLGTAGWVYGIFGIVLPWHGIRRARQRPEI